MSRDLSWGLKAIIGGPSRTSFRFLILLHHCKGKVRISDGQRSVRLVLRSLSRFLTHAPVLYIADPDKEFVVCKNAFTIGLGGDLMQDGNVVCYESWKLNKHEKNYPIHDLELATIIHALKMCRHYLLGKRFVLMSDHIGLRYLFNQLNVNAKQDRWLARSLSLISIPVTTKTKRMGW